MKNVKQLIINNKKSYDDFNVYIGSRNIAPPKKKSIKESVPFSNVVYDFSEMNGEIYWEERTLQYSFDIAEITTEDMEVEKSNLENWLLNVHDDDIYDPYIGDYHFHGSYDSHSWSEDFGAGTLTVTFKVYPYKISNSDSNVIEEIGVSDGLIEGNYGIAGLKIDGKSYQDGTPTPEAPVEIESVEISEIISNGKNLLENTAVSATNNGITFTVHEDKSITCDGNTGTDYALCNMLVVYELPKQLKKGVPYIFCGASEDVSVQIYEWQEKWVQNVVCSSNKNEFTISEKAKGLLIRIAISTNKSVSNKTIYPMIIPKSCKNDSYEPYRITSTPFEITLRSLPNGVCDTIEEDGIHRRVGSVVFDGSDDEDWGFSGTSYYNRINDKRSNYEQKATALICSHFIVQGWMGNANNVGYISETYWSSGNKNILINYDNGAGGVSNFKTWLSENPIQVDYELGTEVIESFTEEQLSAINGIQTYDETTNIFLNSELQTTYTVYYNEPKNITITNNSSHRISPTITSTGKFTIAHGDKSYSIGEGTYNNVFYLAEGENKLTITGYGTITFSYSEEVF